MTDAPFVRCAIVIPAYRPSAGLVDLIRTLSGNSTTPIVLIDDGSGSEFSATFAAAAAHPSVRLLRHQSNLGKGAALKTGIRFALAEYPDLAGIVTADADGQHHPDDIARVESALLAWKSGGLVLGARSFAGAVPLRSRLGNVLTRSLMHVLLGNELQDTQTGLRGIPVTLLPQLLQLDANGYEFELEMLILAHQQGIPVAEVPIRTIYEPGNQSSHFNPLVDSMKIYFVLLRFASVSLLTALLDNLVFYIAYRRTGEILASQILGRVLAVAFNYWMVRRSVFASRQRHVSTLPKYLALVVVSGSASYGGIRLLGASLGIPPVAAKLMVETALFFVNFAVQRLLIFRPAGIAVRRKTEALTILLWLIFAAFVGVEIYGFSTGRLFAQEIWRPTGIERFWRYVRLFLLFSVPALGFAQRYYLPLIAAVLLLGAALAAGPLAPLAVLLFLASACALGKLLVDDELLATLTGTGLLMLLMLAVARLPVNYPAVWTAVLAAPLALDLRGSSRRFRSWLQALCPARKRSPDECAALALLTFILGAHWLVTLKPENSADGLAMHLAIPINIATFHAMTFQPGRILWSVMPMGADWLYSIVYLLGGEFAARLLNWAMLLVLCGLLYRVVRRWLPRSWSLLLVSLFAASPLVQLVTGSLFVENLLAALLLGMLTAIWSFGKAGNIRYLYAAALLAGAALTTKLAALPFVLLAIPFAVYEARRTRSPLIRCLPALALLLATALPTYTLAWIKTGNPVFPFLNRSIPSPLLDHSVEIRDYRFRQPLTWHTPFDLTFHTSRFYEGQDGSLGFQYLLLAPLALVALWAARRRPVVCASVIALAAMTLVLRSEPNARYLYAGLPLLFVPFAALLAWTRRASRALSAALLAAALFCTCLNIWFLPSSGWYHKDFYTHYEFRRDGFQRFLNEDAPVRAVVRHYNQAHPNSTMLLVSDNDFAEARGNVYENHWHQFDTWQRIQNAVNLPQMMELVDRWKLQYFIGRDTFGNSTSDSQGLRQFLAQCSQHEFEVGGFFLSHISPQCGALPDAPPAAAGAYDDFDPALRFRGEWIHSSDFPNAWQSSVSYTDSKDAEVRLNFEGQAVTYVFTRAQNRGMADILIDGAGKATLDLFAASPQWQSRYRVAGLQPGRHTAVIRVRGEKRKEATGSFVDVDAMIVE